MRPFVCMFLFATFSTFIGCAAHLSYLPSSPQQSYSEGSPSTDGNSIEGDIRNTKGKPVARAHITIQTEDKQVKGQFKYFQVDSDASGHFSVDLPKTVESIKVRVWAKHYQPVPWQDLQVRKGSQLLLSIVMQPCSLGPFSTCETNMVVIRDPEEMIVYDSTSSGAKFSVDERTGELTVQRPP